ncbi:pleckstrin homology domain-containing family M member 2-like isoform X2 [Ruditapes philippinarum]|uniref:pleckstrin homology domain-containing family M member 2-like isoform X2 n=1 Tax=Ruditapes philippinarum TaxID=129788 RepID=UPI00295AF9E9|nr:pleckstrin homology domain-containing family M member 2-like isoform X2 [Ruditapes philippinarum]
MNYVYGRSMVVMDSLNDRMRLKDKIVANVAKAVKSIQELQILSNSGSVTLGNYDWQCHRLCEHLDHTLLHGLRHVTPGYWKIVSEFTHKDCVKEIKRMQNVTTDLGRGRAWLLMALNECLLESYLRCYQQNENLVEEFYVRDALVRDQDKFNVLLTVISGLENTEFQLECNMPYLDLCVYPPNSKHTSNVESTIDFERLSVCSMESVHVPASRPLPQAVFETSEDVRPDRKDSTGSGDRRHSPSLDSGIHSDWNYRQRSITPIDQMSISSTSQDCESSEGAGLEVIHLSKKGKPHKHKKKRKKFVSVSNISEPDINEIYDSVEGPVIKIPPIDDIKFSSAIMNNQNNNEPDQQQGLKPEGNHLQISRTRSPGDGKENETDKVDGNLKTDKHTNDHGNSLGTKGKQFDGNVINSDDSKTKHSAGDSHETESKRVDAANHKKTKSEERPKSGESIFTKLIEARVSDMVNAGEQMENEEKVVDQRSDHKTDINHDKKDGKDVYEFSSDTDEAMRYYSDLYNGESVKEKEILEDVGKEEIDNTADKVVEVVPEVPSIYSKMDESDLSSEDETESFPSNFDAKNKLFNNKTPSRQSNSSTPVGDFKHLGSNFENRRQSDDLDKISVSSEKGSLRNHSAMKAPYSDSNLYGRMSNRNTPDILSANQQRRKSAISNSSANETEDEIITNKMLSNSRSSSRMSTNEIPVYRNSPYLSTDEDKLSVNTHSSNQSPSTDMEGSGQMLQAKVEELIVQKKLNHYTHLTFEDDDGDEDDDNFNQPPTPLRDRATSLKPGEIVLDNNTMLYLMLEVLDENDTIVKMFTCQQGHTEGKIKTTLVLVSMDNLYFVEPLQAKNKFSKQAVISYKNIDFVSIGFNNQILHIACKNKRQKYWLTPGEERITIAMIDCLADSMEKSDSKPGRLEVDTGNTIQKISLQKYIAHECKCESDESEVVCYSLVHWEDPTSDKGSCEWDREGTLYYKSDETANILGSQTWRTAYAALRDSMLCLYNDKNDAKPAHFLSMGGGQCVGCKRDFNSDKNHAIKIMLSNGSFWNIALNSEEEANRWLQGLCQAVSEGMKMNVVRASCVPCCMVLCKQKLLMCHEDLDTNFIRTLGSANLHDITSVLYDDLNTAYIVLVFESDEERISSEKWVLYFNSGHECNRFKTALSDCWFKHFQVEVPVLPIDDFSLQKKCTEMVQHLNSSLTLGNR